MNNILIILFTVVFLIIFFLFNDNFKNIKLDDNIAEIIITNINFENISPNFVTIIGLICNIIIAYILFFDDKETNKKSVIFLFILLLRWLADILDGAIARKYDKLSNLGHYLDTFSDTSLIFIVLIYIGIKFKINYKYIILIFILYLLVINNNYDLFSNHDSIKKDNSKLESFLVNNSYILFIYIYIFYNFLINTDTQIISNNENIENI